MKRHYKTHYHKLGTIPGDAMLKMIIMIQNKLFFQKTPKEIGMKPSAHRTPIFSIYGSSIDKILLWITSESQNEIRRV